ncbi:DUF4097 family beta strand repeat-containing protein [Staphylococcus pasteuri]|uniref:DUF4097 family beta strand repeat-containing protein n=1 Tax=Staphylococcus pasteuri TaxID=45972 RepID=UPI001E379E32|nr:DUF4097 family beta strand repeat-containing protein [Staphylococcus pasteuri]MCE3022344.1 DUF4097 domain-containing protein [Staphylococcus pasteuri]
MRKLIITLFIIGLILSIGFGIGLISQGKKLSSAHHETQLNKEYKDNIKSIQLDVENSDVEIKHGKTFSIKSIGSSDDKVDSKVEKGTWHINDQHNQSNINFRIGTMFTNKIIITLPKEMNELTIKDDAGDIKVDDVVSKKTHINVDSGDITLTDSKLGDLKVNNDSGDILMKHIHFTEGKIKNDSGDIEMKQSIPDQPLNVSNDSGDIHINYKNKAKNTSFTALNDSGDTNIYDKELKQHQIGKGDNKVNLSNDSGDITVK